MSFLNTIVEAKRREVAQIKATVSSNVPQCGRRFCEALGQTAGVALIAEIKKASPSEGVIREDLDPVKFAKMYEEAGASAISVLTDEEFFGGGLDVLKAVRKVTNLPLLRKDFIIDEAQILESREAGADAILLIAAILDDEKLKAFRLVAETLGMAALVEVHDEKELKRALDSGATLIGINNRNLKTFDVDLSTTFELAQQIPKGVLIVSESGMQDRFDVARLRGTIDAVLIGTSIVKADDVLAKVRSLVVKRPLIKICGVKDLSMAQFCVDQGVEFIGFNFVKSSPRYIAPDVAESIIDQLEGVKTVGLFVDEGIDRLNAISRALKLDYVQLHGHESSSYCEKVECSIIKAFRVDESIEAFNDLIEFPLVDLPKGEPGVIKLKQEPSRSYFLAGGLSSVNVCEVTEGLHPFAVDVARGVETDGQKDRKLIQRFINQLEKC